MTTTTITVSNATQLSAALKLATGGETIYLNAGSYGNLSLYKFNPASMVTIQANPGSGGLTGGGERPLFTNINANLSSNVTFSGIEVSQVLAPGGWKTTPMIGIYSSSNFNFINLDVHGILDHNPLGEMSGIRLLGSRDIQIADSLFHDLYNAAAITNSSAVAVTNNTITEVREGIDLGGVHHVLIDHNLITSVIPDYALDPTLDALTGEHPDMIQIWTTNSGGSDDVTISNNALLLGRGLDTHGIFITAQDNSVYSNFLIQNNLISTNNHHAITVEHMNGAIIDHNTVLTSGGTNWIASINLKYDTSIRMTNNISTAFETLSSSGITDTGNLKLHTGGAADATNVLANFVNPLKLLTTSVNDFAEIAGSLAATSGAGFDIPTYNNRPTFATYDALVHSLDAGAYLHNIA